MCKMVFSMLLTKTESPGVVNIETDDQKYSQTGSEFRVPSIHVNGCAMLPDWTVHVSPVKDPDSGNKHMDESGSFWPNFGVGRFCLVSNINGI